MSDTANGLALTSSHIAQPGRKIAHLDRAQILDATEACLNEDGYDGTTIRRIAKRLNCAVGSIYRYFTDKRQLLAAVTQRRFDPVLTASEAGLALDQVLRMYGRIAQEQPEQYLLMFWLASVGHAQPGRHLPPMIEKLISLWSERLGDVRRAELQWAQLHGDLMLGLNLPQPIPMPAPAEAETRHAAVTPGTA